MPGEGQIILKRNPIHIAVMVASGLREEEKKFFDLPQRFRKSEKKKKNIENHSVFQQVRNLVQKVLNKKGMHFFI